jgi:hypothetical protein
LAQMMTSYDGVIRWRHMVCPPLHKYQVFI